jgi:hypothetical protein
MTVSTVSLRCCINAGAQLACTLAQATNQADLYYIHQFKVIVAWMQYELSKEQRASKNFIQLRAEYD